MSFMLHTIGRELEAQILSNGCPYKVIDREATKTATWGNPRIVIEHDGDSYAAPRSQSFMPNGPKVHFTRLVGTKITIYGRSDRAGAGEFEHRGVVEEVLDQVLIALRRVMGARKQRMALSGGSFVVPENLKDSEVQAGAAYELKLVLERAVSERTWAGANAATGTVNSVTSTTRVYRPGEADNDAETACGGA